MSEQNKSFSSVQSQRDIRIEKISKLEAKGQNPFSPSVQRDFNLGFIKFWFRFVHSLEHQKYLDKVALAFSENRIDDVFNIDNLAEELISLHPEIDYNSISFEDDQENIIVKVLEDLSLEIFPAPVTTNTRNVQSHLDNYLNMVHENQDEDILPLPFRPNQVVTLAGRVKSKRVSGQIAFAGLEDESCPEGFQFVFKKDLLEVSAENNLNDNKADKIGNETLSFEDFKDLIDEGDFIQASGYLDFSKTGEPSLFVKSFKILTKSIRPLPTELSDIEQKYRQRYMDMRLHPEVREMFTMKSRFWSATREFMVQNGFLEMHMPTMEETTGGAEASPFITHHSSLDQDFFLRISSELHQKRMIVGGFEKIFDIDKNFRNEGIDDEHLQEFVQMEFYWAYADYDDLINFAEDLMKHTIKETFGTLLLDYKDKNIDWSKPWPRMPYYEFVKHFGGVDISAAKTVQDLQKIADENSIKYEKTDGFGRLLDLIYKRTARLKCIEPVWLIDHPVEISPLAKRKPENPALTQRMQLVAYGSELCNGFSELNDPIDQKARFEEQQAQRDGGDDEAMMIDEDFVEALEIGMPPTAGFAFSERVFSVLLQKPIRETTPFPLMKSKKEPNPEKSKTTKVAHIIILDSPEIPTWAKLNTAAHLSASLAARIGKNLIEIDSSSTKDKVKIPMNIQHAIVMKSASQALDILTLKNQAEEVGLEISLFTKEMLDSSSDLKVKEAQSSKNSSEIGWLGICIFGKKNLVEDLTQNYPRMD